MDISVGSDFESLCGKCGDVWHVVVSKEGDEVVKVQCKQCGATHKPKPIGTAKKKKVTKRKTATRRKTAASAEPELVPANPSRPTQPYAPRTQFEVGDQVQHGTFGPGVVQNLPAPGKMDIHFPGLGTKRLVCGRQL